MREIKFRAWGVDEKVLLSWDFVNGYDMMIIFRNPGFVPMQFTGLKDKNGKEIWEGDIVSWSGELPNSDITFERGSFCALDNSSPNYFPGKRRPIAWLLSTEAMEVIGNIYENPDLLKL